MKNFDDIKNMWQQQQVEVNIPAADIIAKAKKDKQYIGRRLLIQSICLLATISVMIYILSTIKFEMATTYIALGLMILCLVVFGLLKLWQYKQLYNIDLTNEPKQIIQQLELFYKQQKWINTYGLGIYSVVLNIAFILYFIETFAPLSVAWKWGVGVIYTAWMLFALFVLGRRSIKKEHQKMQDIINRIKAIAAGLKE
jgi:hypothetical protein